MLCAICYHLYIAKKVKNTHGGVLLLVTFLHGCFSRFQNFTNDTKSRNASQINNYMEDKISNLMTGFRKSQHSTVSSYNVQKMETSYR